MDSRPLTDTQLAVARWVVAGYGSVAIARRLSLNHHTIARWKRDPRMVEFIRHLRARADAVVVEMTARMKVIAAGGRSRSGESREPSSADETHGLPPAATNNAPSGTGSTAERILARIIMQRRDARGA